MFDLRYATSADLDRINAEARAWKQREQPDLHTECEEVNQSEPEQMELPI